MALVSSETMLQDIPTFRDMGVLLAVVLFVLDCVSKFKVDSAYGCRRSLPDGMAATRLDTASRLLL